ncbi:MAG: class I SAM-dependent methyltransferase [Bacteroidota bacterium]
MNRDKLVKVFDDNANSYDKYRPKYPNEVIEELIDLSQIKAKDKILEIGCGTGQITIDFVKRGYEVVGIEKGESLSRIASNKIEKYGIGKIINSTFEDWVTSEKFKLVIAAQAFHWIDKKRGINKILRLLKDNGSIGLIWNVDKSQETEFWEQTSKVYDKYLPKKKGQGGMEETIEEHWDYIYKRKELINFGKREYQWEKVYSKEEYLGLLNTFSPHMSMELNKRERFFKEIKSIIEGLNNRVLKNYKTVLLFANKRS